MINNEIERRKGEGVDYDQFYAKTEYEIQNLKDEIAERYNLISESLKMSTGPVNLKSQSNNSPSYNKNYKCSQNTSPLISHYMTEINLVIFILKYYLYY